LIEKKRLLPILLMALMVALSSVVLTCNATSAEDSSYIIIELETENDVTVYLQGQDIEDMLQRVMTLGNGSFGQYVGVTQYYDLIDEITYLAAALAENDEFLNQKIDSVLIEVDDAMWQASIRMDSMESVFESQNAMIYEILPSQMETMGTEIEGLGDDMSEFRTFVVSENDQLFSELDSTNAAVLDLEGEINALKTEQERTLYIIAALAITIVLLLLAQLTQYILRHRAIDVEDSTPYATESQEG